MPTVIHDLLWLFFVQARSLARHSCLRAAPALPTSFLQRPAPLAVSDRAIISSSSLSLTGSSPCFAVLLYEDFAQLGACSAELLYKLTRAFALAAIRRIRKDHFRLV